jgi:glycolate oxidase subunit GlcD
MTPAALQSLTRLVGEGVVVAGSLAPYSSDATEHEGFAAAPDAVALPRSTEEVRLLVEWACRQGVPIVPRGGGTGFSGGAVPVSGGLVVDLSRMHAIRSFDPGLWRMEVEAGVLTATVHRMARENGLYFPPDPGAAEQSQIGGNIATNAGGPHAFKYGVTGSWVTGLEAVVAPGDVIRVGGAVRKDVAAYDLKSLLIGSEGTLGIVTSAWLRLIPAPEVQIPLVATFPTVEAGCEAIQQVLASGVVASAIEFLDGGALEAARRAFPVGLSQAARFLIIVEVDGSALEAAREAQEVRAAVGPEALDVFAPEGRGEVQTLWRWRDGMSQAVSFLRGGKVSEDIAVPVDQLAVAVHGTVEIGRAHGLRACSWGHAGDGNLHSTFMIDASDPAEIERAHAAARELFELAVRLGGSISGEHGLGWLKRGQLGLQLDPRALALHGEIKRLFDPTGIMNPGKKT